MNFRSFLAPSVLSFLIAGCATFSTSEMGQLRQSGVSPAVIAKFQDSRPLSPSEVIQLSRHGVADGMIIREIEDAGVDYVLAPNDLKRLENARVNRPVVEALIAASDEFARDHSPSRTHVYGAYPPYPYGPYYGPYPYYYPYGGVQVEVGGGRHWGHHWR